MFNVKGKLSPLYIGFFMIVVRVGKLAYRLDLRELYAKCVPYLVRHITMEQIIIYQDLAFESHPVRIIER